MDSEKYVDFPLSFRVNTIGNITFKHQDKWHLGLFSPQTKLNLVCPGNA